MLPLKYSLSFQPIQCKIVVTFLEDACNSSHMHVYEKDQEDTVEGGRHINPELVKRKSNRRGKFVLTSR